MLRRHRQLAIVWDEISWNWRENRKYTFLSLHNRQLSLHTILCPGLDTAGIVPCITTTSLETSSVSRWLAYRIDASCFCRSSTKLRCGADERAVQQAGSANWPFGRFNRRF